MKYRLIRFKEGKMVLDKECSAPNQFGSNEEWRDQGNTALLIEIRSNATVTYHLRKDIETNKHVLWLEISEQAALEQYPYYAMLKLNGAI